MNQIKRRSRAKQRQCAADMLSSALMEAVDEAQYSVSLRKPFDLLGCMRFLLSQAGKIVLCGLLCALIAGIVFSFVPPKYAATAKLYILENDGTGVQISALQSGTLLMADYREVLKTWEVHEKVRSQLGLDMTYRDMQELLSIQIPDGSRLLYITVKHADPVFAAELANAYAQAAYSFIVQTLHGMHPDLFSSAVIPGETIGLGIVGGLIVAFAVGMMLAAGGYVLFFCLDDHIRTTEDLALASDLPVLSAIPRRKTAMMTVEEKEKACLLASRIRTANAKCVLVSAQRSGDGVSFVCNDLVQAMTALYCKAVWIKVEHKPFWNHASGATLGEYLNGRCGWKELVQPFEGGALISVCGTEDELPSQLFHPGMATLMDKLRSVYDVVLVDVPPAHQRADASAFYGHCDGVILVAACGQSRIDEISDYAGLLVESSCPILGAVLNRAPVKAAARARHTVAAQEGVPA